MKKMVSIICSIILLFSNSLSTYAIGNEIDSILIEKGFPQEIILSLNDGLKEQIALDEFTEFESVKIVNYDIETGRQCENSSSGNVIVPYGAISDSDLKLTLLTTTNTSNGNKQIYFEYRWLNIPLNRYEDAIVIYFDPDCFLLQENTFSKTDKFSGYKISDGTPVSDKIKSTSSLPSDSNLSCMAWYADLAGHEYTVTKLYGYGSFEVAKKSGFEPTTIHVKYAHANTTTSVGINLYVFNASFSGGEHDTLSTFINVN